MPHDDVVVELHPGMGEDAIAQADEAHPVEGLTVIGVPGPFAALEAHRALSAGSDVMLLTGDVPLASVQVTDDLETTFTGATSYEVTAVAATGTLTANAGFNGDTDKNLLSAGTLAFGAVDTITVTVKLAAGNKLQVY